MSLECPDDVVCYPVLRAAHGPANTLLFDATPFSELFQVGDVHAIVDNACAHDAHDGA